jgi:uncharacterized protein (TIGR03083 family)
MLEERRDIRRLLGELTSEQWATPSLCAGWTVRDLTAHLVGWDDLLLYRTPREHRRALVRFIGLYGASFASMRVVNARIQRRTRDLGPDELLGRFGADGRDDLKWLFDGTNAAAHLAEYVIHHQDIRRPLGLSRDVPPERLVAALDGIAKLPGVRWLMWRRLQRTRFEATDVDWARGAGRTGRATGEEILMRLAGRTV